MLLNYMSEYQITKRQEDNATRENVIIFPADKDSKKKIEVYDEDGLYMFSIGDKRYKDYDIYLKEKGKQYADNRRRLYKIRHEKTRHKKGTPSYFADRILW
jgi:hypothetical protein